MADGAKAKFPDLMKTVSGLFSGGGGGSSTCVGLSIGSSSIKIIELKKSGKSWKLLHFGMVQLAEDVVINREIANSVAVVESIKALVSQIKLKSKNVCAGISGASIIIKKISLEVPKKTDLQSQVFWEAEQYLPFDVSEVYMDYQVLSRTKEGKTDVLLVALRTVILDSFMSAIEGAGLKAKVIDADVFAMQNVFEANYPSTLGEAVAIFDIGASSIKTVIIQDGIPIFTKDSSLGGKNLTAEIQKNLNLSYADAETLKIGGQGGDTPQEVSDLMGVVNESFAGEMKRTIDFYNASSVGAPVSYILLSGGSSKTPGLSKTVEDATSLPTQIINPFNSISYDPGVFTPDYIAAIAPIAAVPIGLALRAGAK